LHHALQLIGIFNYATDAIFLQGEVTNKWLARKLAS